MKTNQTIRSLENEIIGLINDAELPIEVCRLILSEIYEKVNKQASAVIYEEMNEKPETIKEEGKLNAESTRCEL